MGIFVKSQDALFKVHRCAAQLHSNCSVRSGLAGIAAIIAAASWFGCDRWFWKQVFHSRCRPAQWHGHGSELWGRQLDERHQSRRETSTSQSEGLRKLPVADVSEGATIFSLMLHFNNYRDDLPYWCLPGEPDSTTGLAYNSNSFAHGSVACRRSAAPRTRTALACSGLEPAGAGKILHATLSNLRKNEATMIETNAFRWSAVSVLAAVVVSILSAAVFLLLEFRGYTSPTYRRSRR